MPSYEQADVIKKDTIWKKMGTISLRDIVKEWASYMPYNTGKNYLSGINRLAEIGILDLDDSLQNIALTNHDVVFDKIATIPKWSESSKQSRAALYISLIRFLSRKTEGIIKKAIPRKDEATRTFFRVREKVKTEALSPKEWKKLIAAMEMINPRDAMIAKLCLQGARRIHEVIELKVTQINREKRQVCFVLNKTRCFTKHVVVTVSQQVMDDLMSFVNHRTSGHVFITNQGKKVHYTQVLRSLKRAARRSSINKRMHTHVLRTSAITHIRSLGFQDFEILRLTGHSSFYMLNAYDKHSVENNTSQKVSLI